MRTLHKRHRKYDPLTLASFTLTLISTIAAVWAVVHPTVIVVQRPPGGTNSTTGQGSGSAMGGLAPTGLLVLMLWVLNAWAVAGLVRRRRQRRQEEPPVAGVPP